jgi:hypothetical protein
MDHIASGYPKLCGEGSEEANDILKPIILGAQNLIGIGEN